VEVRPRLALVEGEPALRSFLDFTCRRVLDGSASGILLLATDATDLLDALAGDPDPAIRATRILALTARVEGLQRTDVLGVVHKPIDLDDLLETIARHYA
jgi:hypothetical protein